MKKLLSQIWKTLPEGWQVFYQPKDDRNVAYNFIRIERTVPILQTSRPGQNANNNNFRSSSWRAPAPTPFEANFTITPLLSVEEYAAKKARNQAIEKELEQLYESIITSISHKFDYFLPSTPEQKVKVNYYNTLKSSRISLPDFYVDGMSVSWFSYWFETNEYEQGYPLIVDKTIRKECVGVMKKIVSLMKACEPTVAKKDG